MIEEDNPGEPVSQEAFQVVQQCFADAGCAISPGCAISRADLPDGRYITEETFYGVESKTDAPDFLEVVKRQTAEYLWMRGCAERSPPGPYYLHRVCFNQAKGVMMMEYSYPLPQQQQ
jgi:hypothetical protein